MIVNHYFGLVGVIAQVPSSITLSAYEEQSIGA